MPRTGTAQAEKRQLRTGDLDAIPAILGLENRAISMGANLEWLFCAAECGSATLRGR